MLLVCLSLSAVDLGVKGHTFSIAELDLIEYLREKLENTTPDEIESLNAAFKKKCCETIETPPPLNIPYATKYRVFTFDPTITVRTDVLTDEGKILVPKGTRYNPLERNHTLNNSILFIDGTNNKHIEWAREMEGTWVLTKGSPIKLENREHRPVYFDQGGVIIKKLGIKAIPAMVSQEKVLLKVEEILLGGS